MFENILKKIQYTKSTLNEHNQSLLRDILYSAIDKHHDRFSHASASKQLSLLSFSYAISKHKRFLNSEIFCGFLCDYFQKEFNLKPQAIIEALDNYLNLINESSSLMPPEQADYDFLEKSFIDIYLAKDEESIIEDLGLGQSIVQSIGDFFIWIENNNTNQHDDSIINKKFSGILKTIYDSLCSNNSLIETKKLHHILKENSLGLPTLTNSDLELILDALFLAGKKKCIQWSEFESKLIGNSKVENFSPGVIINCLIRNNIIYSHSGTNVKNKEFELTNVGYELTAKRFAHEFISDSSYRLNMLLSQHSYYQSATVTILAQKKPDLLLDWLKLSRKLLSPSILRAAVESLGASDNSNSMIGLCKTIIYDQNLNLRLRSVATKAIFDLAPVHESTLIYHSINKANLSEKIKFLASDYLRKIGYLSNESGNSVKTTP